MPWSFWFHQSFPAKSTKLSRNPLGNLLCCDHLAGQNLRNWMVTRKSLGVKWHSLPTQKKSHLGMAPNLPKRPSYNKSFGNVSPLEGFASLECKNLGIPLANLLYLVRLDCTACDSANGWFAGWCDQALDELWPNRFLVNLCQQQVKPHWNYNNAAYNPFLPKNVSVILAVGTWTPPYNPKGVILSMLNKDTTFRHETNHFSTLVAWSCNDFYANLSFPQTQKMATNKSPNELFKKKAPIQPTKSRSIIPTVISFATSVLVQ